jgi:hypothetical protein
MMTRMAPSMSMIALGLLLASALALALMMFGLPSERGLSVRPAEAASKVSVVAKCDGNPEKVLVTNNTRHGIKIRTVGSVYRPYGFEPISVGKRLGGGRMMTFESGPRANGNVLTKQYIFNSDVGSREGARVATSVGRFVDRCG